MGKNKRWHISQSIDSATSEEAWQKEVRQKEKKRNV
jgi:hypothetical protein